MANNIKGITIEIGGNTTKLQDALKDVNAKSKSLNSELSEVNKLLKFDPDNADLLAQKQKILADRVANTKDKLDALKDAERQVQAQFAKGEASEEQVRAIERAVISTTQQFKRYSGALVAAKKDLDQVIETNNMIASTGFKALAGVVTSAITGLTAAAEMSREYRAEMGKLDAAFSAQGHSADTATEAYKTLQGVIGETDQSVEAAQQISLLADSEEDVAKWAGLASGVVGQFGDALQPETFFEAANETLKLGEATGAYVQMLEGTGMSVEEFNKGLEKCNTEAEKQAYMLEVSEKALGAAGAAYEETNADVIAANEANEAWMSAMAGIGAVVEPIITSVKEFGATLIEKVTPVLKEITENLPVVGVALAGAAASMVAFKVAAIAATAASKGLTLAQYAVAAAQKVLNAVMSANIFGLVILGITGLVAAFMYLWKNSETFRENWLKLWEKIQSAVANVAEWFKTLPEKISSAISGAIENVRVWGENMVERVKTAATNFITNAVNILKNIPAKVSEAISGAIAKVTEWGSNLANKAKTAATNFLNNVATTLKNIPSKVYSAIQGAVSKVSEWGSNMVSKAKTAAKNVLDTVVNNLKNLPGKIKEIGGNLVTGLWNGLNDKLTWLKNKIKSFTSSVLSSIKSFFGVNSPSKETAWIGEMLDEGLAAGIEDSANVPMRAMSRVAEGVLDNAKEVNGANFDRQVKTTFAPQPSISAADSLGAKLDKILTAIEKGQILTIDGKAFVGGTADKYDRALGNTRLLVERGAL